MSAPPRGPHAGGTMSGRSTPPPTSRGRGSWRSSTSAQLRGRGGRGRGAASTTNPKAEGLVQGLQTGSLNKRGESSSARANRGRSSTPRGPARSTRDRGTLLNRANDPSVQSKGPSAHASSSYKDFMTEMTTKFQDLRQRREAERAKAIRDGFLADPEKKTSLDKAITPVGTCTEMCPEFERVERIVQNMVEKPEKMLNETTGRDIPAEERMVKRFRRSAAGYDEQLPSDIRTPATLQATLNYLLDDVIGGGEQLAAVHKFVWDRTRGIRNDFSIQQVSKDEDVRLAVDCFERIARFHILSLHQLSNPDILSGEAFDAHQEREQLNNTLLSLMYYYDDNRGKQRFPNEAEFRAYCIIFELQTQHPDLADRMQSWPPELLSDKRVQTAYRLYSAATNILFDQGPLKPLAPFSIAQGNSGAFWKLLKSKSVSYLMSCVAEIYFGQVRYLALQNLWESHKGPTGQQARNQEWTLDELTDALAFDDDEETLEFCQRYGLSFKTSDDRVHHLVFQASSLDQSSTPNTQIFSHSIVEAKRYRRSLVAVINGVGVARAIREGLIEADLHHDGEPTNAMEDDSGEGLFFPENSTAPSTSGGSKSASTFNPEASSFTPSAATLPNWSSSSDWFGKPSVLTPFPPPTATLSASTTIEASGSSLPSSLPTNSTPSPTVFSISSTPFQFQSKSQPLPTSASTSTTATAPISFPGFSFAQPSTSASVPTSTTSSYSFGTPSTAPSTFDLPSVLEQDKGQEQTPRLANTGDTPFSVPSLSGTSTPWTFLSVPPNETGETFPLSAPDNKPPGGSLWPDSKMSHEGSRGTAQDQPPVFQAAFPASSEPDNVNAYPTPSEPPPSTGPSKLETSERSTNPLLWFLQPNISTDFRVESPFTTLNAGNTSQNITQPPTTSISAPNPLSSFDSTSEPSSKQSDATSTPQPSFIWNIPVPSEEDSPNPQPPNLSERTPLLPSQYPAPSIPPKARKSIRPKTKELKAVSPVDPTPRTSSPLRERPVIFGDNANAFRQSAALATNPPRPRATTFAQDRDRATETVARLALLQPAGLMQEYLQFKLPDLLKPVMQRHEREKPILAAQAARQQILAKKYFRWWRTSTYRRVRNRQARERRQMRIDAFERERRQRMRGEAELEAILQAKKESERIQAERLAHSMKDSAVDGPYAESRELRRRSRLERTAGHKRKSIHVDFTENWDGGDAQKRVARGHNRSKTAGQGEELFDLSSSAATRLSAARTTNQSRSSIHSGRSILNGSETSTDMPRTPSGRRDTTRTDYFRLKALGIDPDTPIVPDTTVSLERKRQREEESTIAVTKPRATALSSPPRPPVPRFSPQSATAYRTSSPDRSGTQPDATRQIPASASDILDDDEDFLRKIREVRQTMAEGAEWFKTQTANIEIEEQAELRRSASQGSTRSSPHPSAGSLARANGYDYLPGPEVPGRSLSRTEQRIRRTGAHGLATKPLGGSDGYLAVAMSRDTAAKLNMEKQSRPEEEVQQQTEKTRRRKRKAAEKDDAFGSQQSEEDSEEFESDVKSSRLRRRSMPGSNDKMRKTESNHHHPEPDEQVAEEYDRGEEDDGDVLESLERPTYAESDQTEGGDTEDLYEDGDDEEEPYDEDGEGTDGAGEEEEADEVSLAHRHGQKGNGQISGYWLRSSATPERGLMPNSGGQTMSRASSGMGTGTGASVDDALVLDSD